MHKKRPILISCPHYQGSVPGTYDCDDSGKFLLGTDGSFLLERTHCGHNAGRCTQSLCVLHRYNRGGTSSWFPSHIVASAAGGGKKKPRGAKPKAGQVKKTPPGMDMLC